MRLTIAFILFCGLTVQAQTSTTPAPMQGTSTSLQSVLSEIEVFAQDSALTLAKLRIEKWKVDGDFKEQSQQNSDSLQRNLTAALPTLTQAVRVAPTDIAANFKLYRNLNALYDVMEGLAESAGSFGPKSEFEALSQHTASLDQFRRQLGDYIEGLTSQQQAELNRLRGGSTSSASKSSRTKKIIVDDNAPRKKKR